MDDSSRLHVNLKELVNYDIQLHGTKVIIPEFCIASAIGAAISFIYLLYPGLAEPTRLQSISWLGFTLNCLILLALAVGCVRAGMRKQPNRRWSDSEIVKLRRYTLLMGILIIVPYATLTTAVSQSLVPQTVRT